MTGTVTMIDRISAIVLQNGVMRIDCISIGPNNEERQSGTLLIPAVQVGNVINSLAQGTQELEKRIREATEQQAAAAKPVAGSA
jgi:hypothetical protein